MAQDPMLEQQAVNPQVACMLAAMASAAYVPYLDYEYAGTSSKQVAQIFVKKKFVLDALRKPKDNPGNHNKYLYDKLDAIFLEDFEIIQLPISNVAVFYGTTSTCAGIVAARQVQKRLEVLIAFRGTQSYSELLTDLKAVVKGKTEDIVGNQFKVHRGFNSIFESVKDQIDDAIRLAAKKFPNTTQVKIYTTGHSLGAALSVLCAYYYMNKGQSVDVYNFGCPRVGNSEFNKSFIKLLSPTKSSYFRFYRATDNVPGLPLRNLGYEHVNIGYELKEKLKKDTISKKIGAIVGPYTNPAYGHSIERDRQSIYIEFYDKALRAAVQQQSKGLSYETSTVFSHFLSNFDPTLNNAPVLINGEKIIFDKAVPTTPVALEAKPARRQVYTNGNAYRPY